MRLLNSCRFKKFCSLLTVMLLMLFSVIPASAAELSTDEKAEVLVGTEYAIEIPSSMADNTVAISVDDIMEHSTVTTYGASMEGSYESEKDVSVSTSGVTWNTALSGGAQKAAFTFKPGINFQCPSNKSSVSVTANASYTLDSWDSGREEISLNKSFTCYPDRVS